MADKILATRRGGRVGKSWTQRFVSRTDELKMAFNRAKDRQRVLQEDPEVISKWFELVRTTIAKYGVQPEDIHNFDESGFQMGVIGAMKVVTGSERRTKPTLMQGGNREWVTVIQSICASGRATPPFIIYKGRVHISAWYEEAGIPHDWKFAVSDNGWTNNELGLEWLQHFDAHTKHHTKGAHRLLILDGHESHQSQEFKDYCLENKILTLCMPSHSSHILQPLDVVCFSPLKLKYSQRVRDLARRHVFHIDKEGFLPAFRDAFLQVFTHENCKKAFKATGLVPLNAQVVLDCLDIHLRTPSPPPASGSPWQSQTPSNTHEFSSQSKLVRDSFVRSPSAAQQGFSQLIKGAEEMLHKSVLMEARVRELEAQLAEVTKRKGRKRKRIQKGGVLAFSEGASHVAVEASNTSQRARRSRGGDGGEKAQPSQRRCRNCGEAGHNSRTCKIEIEISSAQEEEFSCNSSEADSE